MTDQAKTVEVEPANIVNLHSDRIDLEVKTEPRCRVTLTIKAKPSLLKEAKLDAVKQVSKEVSIPGFRKGKAPAGIIESKYPGAINQAWDRSFADVAFKECQELAKVPVLNNSSNITYKVISLNEDAGEVSFQFEREPEFPAIDYSSFSLKEGKLTPVSEENIDNTIKGIQMFYAKWNQVTDRAVKEGDFVILDIDDIDQDPPVQAFSHSRFEVAQKKMADWMREAVIGKNLNDCFETVSAPDASETEEIKAQFKPKKVKISIKGIEEAILPEVTDEFTKKVGAPDVASLRAQLTNLLTKQSADNHQTELREAIADQILEKITFEVPGSMLEKEANYRMSNLFKNPDFLKKWKNEMSEEEKETKKQEVISQAEQAIRLFYICRTILSENNIHISEDDLQPNYNTILEMMFADPNLVNYKNQSRETQAVEFSKYMMSKAQDFIIAKIRPDNI
jgi:trigger factor